MAGFKDLRVWHDSVSLAHEIYQLTSQAMFKHDFSLRDQIRRAAVSVSSNIAEGHERGSHKDSIRFFYIAKGSIAEVISQLYVAMKIGYLEQDHLRSLEDHCEKIKASLINLIKARATFIKDN